MKGLLLVGLLSLVSCMGGSGGSGKVSNPDKVVVSKTFSDSTVSNFLQTDGIASRKKQWYEFIIEKAYADSGNISCYSDSSVTISMDVTLGGTTDNLVVNTTCGDDIDLAIRRKMLAALEGHQLILEVAGTGDVGTDYILDFRGGFAFNQAYPTFEEEKTIGGITGGCKIDYIFDSATGKVRNNTIAAGSGHARYDNEQLNTTWGIANPNSSNIGCKSDSNEYRDASFRFKDGKIELDESGTKHFSPKGCAKRDAQENIIEYNEDGAGDGSCPVGFDSTYERWCVDDDLDGNCDA